MPDRAVLPSHHDFKNFKVVLAGLSHIDTGKLRSTLLAFLVGDGNLMDGVREEVCVEDGV